MKARMWLPCLLLLFAVTACADVLYSNGPANGNYSAYLVQFGQTVTDSFVLTGPATVTGATAYLWVPIGESPQTIDWAITTSPFGGATLGAGTGTLGNALFNPNAHGMYDVFASSFTFAPLDLVGGTYWLQLGNGAATLGGNVFWDINLGPSQAFVWNANNPIDSEAFTIEGTYTGNPVPEPASMALVLSGMLGFWRATKRR